MDKDSIFEEVTPEEEEQMINRTYEFISKYGLEDAALLILFSIKPMASLGGSLGRFFLGPVTPFIGHREETLISTFEQSKNIEKLIERIEKKRREKREKKDDNKEDSD